MSEASENPVVSEERFTRLPRDPETQTGINQMFNESGVAKLVVDRLKQQRHNNWTSPINIEDCNFGVHRGLDYRREREELSIIVDFTNPDPDQRDHLPRAEMSMGFDVKGGSDYVGYGVFLDEPQGRVVQDALKLQEAETAK